MARNRPRSQRQAAKRRHRLQDTKTKEEWVQRELEYFEKAVKKSARNLGDRPAGDIFRELEGRLRDAGVTEDSGFRDLADLVEAVHTAVQTANRPVRRLSELLYD